MALSRIWVYAEARDGEVLPITLEILAKATELADTVECVYGGDGRAVAATLMRLMAICIPSASVARAWPTSQPSTT